MRKKINILLGALITLLTGCKAQQEAILPERNIMVMYGPPAYFQQQDTTSQENPQESNEANSSLPITQ